MIESAELRVQSAECRVKSEEKGSLVQRELSPKVTEGLSNRSL